MCVFLHLIGSVTTQAKAHTGSRKESQPLSVKVPCREEEAREEALERILHQLHTSFTQLEVCVGGWMHVCDRDMYIIFPR